VAAHCRIKILAKGKKYESRRKCFVINKIKNVEVKEQFKIELKNRHQILSDVETENVKEMWDAIRTNLLELSENSFGYRNRFKKDWMSVDIWNLIEKRNTVKLRLNSCKTRNRKK
jgi:hypothetical protein